MATASTPVSSRASSPVHPELSEAIFTCNLDTHHLIGPDGPYTVQVRKPDSQEVGTSDFNFTAAELTFSSTKTPTKGLVFGSGASRPNMLGMGRFGAVNQGNFKFTTETNPEFDLFARFPNGEYLEQVISTEAFTGKMIEALTSAGVRADGTKPGCKFDGYSFTLLIGGEGTTVQERVVDEKDLEEESKESLVAEREATQFNPTNLDLEVGLRFSEQSRGLLTRFTGAAAAETVFFTRISKEERTQEEAKNLAELAQTEVLDRPLRSGRSPAHRAQGKTAATTTATSHLHVFQGGPASLMATGKASDDERVESEEGTQVFVARGNTSPANLGLQGEPAPLMATGAASDDESLESEEEILGRQVQALVARGNTSPANLGSQEEEAEAQATVGETQDLVNQGREDRAEELNDVLDV